MLKLKKKKKSSSNYTSGQKVAVYIWAELLAMVPITVFGEWNQTVMSP